MTSHPFEPPVVDRGPQLNAWLVVLASWALAGALVGNAIGVTLQLTHGLTDASPRLAFGSMAAWSAMGALVLATERAFARSRPELVDGRGVRSRPVHGALVVVPLIVAIPALLWLVVVGSVAVRSVMPALVFGILALGAGWAARRAWSHHRLARALEVLEQGRRDEAVALLGTLLRPPFVSSGTRTAARLNLAQLALTDGDADAALRWAEQVRGGTAGAWAAVVRALAHLVRGDAPELAEKALAEALASRHAGAVQAEADAVRVLLVWRRDGKDDARILADSLYGPASSALHGALLHALRGGREAPGPDVTAVRASALGRAIPELWG